MVFNLSLDYETEKTAASVQQHTQVSLDGKNLEHDPLARW
jgi:hypothetical protein